MDALDRVRAPIDVIVPVPLHASRLASRKYNQASLLAAPLARRLGVKLVTGVLDRVRDTRAQAELDREARLVNLDGAFAVHGGPSGTSLTGARVLLVDDVRTTGSTLRACAAALHEAGAADVHALVVARTGQAG
jgi:ComF family protein